jgi:pimeloyl-ACP methyl ester carboxylesterase
VTTARHRIAARLAVAFVCLFTAACGTSGPTSTPPGGASPSAVAVDPSGSASAIPTPVPASTASEGRLVDIGGFSLWIECQGAGESTVVLEAGLGDGARAWTQVARRLAETTRVCVYDRAGIGRSEPRPERVATAGVMADELGRLLDAAAIDGPVVLAGHSYGGMVVQLAADRRPDLVAGVVLVDSSSGRQFEEAFPVTHFAWEDGSTEVDKVGSAAELAAVDLGAIPLVVLTQDGLDGELGADWERFQAELAGLSTTSLHLTATGAGHGIPTEAPGLVVAAVSAVVDAVEGAQLPPCADFAAAGGACFEP